MTICQHRHEIYIKYKRFSGIRNFHAPSPEVLNHSPKAYLSSPHYSEVSWTLSLEPHKKKKFLLGLYSFPCLIDHGTVLIANFQYHPIANTSVKSSHADLLIIRFRQPTCWQLGETIWPSKASPQNPWRQERYANSDAAADWSTRPLSEW